MSHVTSRSCDGMWNMKHEEWCHKWCHMEKGYKHGKSYLNQGLRYIFRIIKAWRHCEWQKGINKIENKSSWIYLKGNWIPCRLKFAVSQNKNDVTDIGIQVVSNLVPRYCSFAYCGIQGFKMPCTVSYYNTWGGLQVVMTYQVTMRLCIMAWYKLVPIGRWCYDLILCV